MKKIPTPRHHARNTPAPGLPVKGSSCERNVIKASTASILCEGSKWGIKKEVSTQFFLFYYFYFYLLAPSPSFTHHTPLSIEQTFKTSTVDGFNGGV